VRRGSAPALALAAAALLAAGCGGDDDSEGGGDTQSKAAWVEQADGICASAEQDLNQAVAQQFGGKPPSDAEQEQFVTEETIPSLQSQHDEIADLAAPEGAEEQADALLAALQSGIDALKADPASIQAAGADAPLANATQLADRLGLTDCGG
jgi:hypothetical protein